ncbi:hypothetical protein CHUAL_012233, partial [Chamberlinius hualienensis]
MTELLMDVLQTLLFASDNRQLVTHLSHFLIVGAIFVVILTAVGYSPTETYGRYHSWPMWTIPAGFAWFLQESPAFVVPLLLIVKSDVKLVNTLVIGVFMLHYFHRSFIYPIFRTGKPMPLDATVSAFLFCLLNGIMQGNGIIRYAEFPYNYLLNLRFILGVFMFVVGFYINITSDYRLASLRKPGETGYKIPTGGLFEYVSCANYL